MIVISSEEEKANHHNEYEVDKIVGRRQLTNGIRYKVKWLGYGDDECTW